jgi:hypothetical protein
MRSFRFFVLLLAMVAGSGLALVPPEHSDLHDFEFRHADLWWSSVYQSLDEFPREVTKSARTDLDVLGVDHQRAFLDRRTGRWGTLILTRSMIPGTGIGNDLRWSEFDQPPPHDHYELMDAASAAFLQFLADHEVELGFAADEMTAPRMQVHGDDRIQMYIGRSIDGVPVRDSYIIANINSGNLILMGQRNWADLTVDTRPSLSETDAESVLITHLRGLQPGGYRTEPTLELIPVSDESDHNQVVAIGQGLDYRLVWVLTPLFRENIGSWEAQVDAHTGELVAFVDTNHYHSDEHEHVSGGSQYGQGDAHLPLSRDGEVSRGIIGGIFPVSNDGQAPDGVELTGAPMPFANVNLDGAPIGFTTTGGNTPTSAGGTLSTTLAGQYVTINSSCGTVNVSGSDTDLDLGDGAATNCAVPSGTSAGNTNASRTVFYGVGRINEQARGYLPNNNWLTAPITGRTNVSQTCNATWNTGTNTATFYNSGGGCANTGEIMAVVHHEWGHGMDANSVNPGISRPGEGIADIYAQNMLNDSCIGRNFRPGQNCGGFGDPCLECTGVRESDWALQQSGQPHDIAWIQSACPSGFGTPCGRSTHCEGSVVAEAIWDLVHRDLQGYEGSPFDYDLNTALELGTRLTYEGAGAVGDWYQCTTNNGGCNADSGYLQYLAADADNGSIEDGTPHMSAIFAAFDRHQLACSTPTVQNTGCQSGPSEAPENLAVTNLNEGAALSWDPVDDATEYWIYRTEGPMGCDFGKARVGQVSGTTFSETGLRNDFDVYYSVIAAGSGGSCTGPMSPCVTATPAQGPSGTVEGTVIRGGSGAPLEDVLIEVIGDVSLSTTTDQDGNYSLNVLEGEYEVIASRPGFEPASETDVEVIEDVTVTVDLVLDAPILDPETSEFNLVVGEGGTTSAELKIDNPGTSMLQWTLDIDAESLAGQGGRGFQGDFDVDNWELINSPSNTGGSVNVEDGPPIEVYVIGGDDGVSGDTDLQIEIPSDGTITFDWGYQSSDTGQFDSGGYVINGNFTVLAFNNSQVPFFSESSTVEVSAGDIFAFRVNTDDGLFGEGVLGVTNFQFEADICGTPEGVSWLSVDPDAGTVAPGNSGESTLLVDADGLAQGDYEAFLCLGSNDPTFQETIIPVNLTVTEPVPDPAQLQVAHLAPVDDQGSAVDIALNGDVVLSGVEYGDSTGYLPVPEGTYTIEIFPADEPTPLLTVSGVELDAGVSYSALANGDADNQDFGLILLVDDHDAPAAGNFKLRLGHLAPFAAGAASAEVRLADGTLLEEVDFGDVTGFIELTAGTYDLQITAPGGSPVLIDPEPVTFADGDVISAYAVGEGVNVDLGVFALPPGDPGFFLPLVQPDPAELDVDPTDLAFGEVDLGDDATLSFTVSNAADPGAMSLELSTLSLSGDAEFAITGGDCGAGTVLEAGESCGVDVTFTPSAEDTFSGAVEVATVDGQSGAVSLSAAGFDPNVPEADISPASFSFTLNAGDAADDVLDIANLTAPGADDLVWSIATDEVIAAGSRFDGDFDIDNWTFENDPAGVNGSFFTNPGPPVELFIIGGDDGVGGNADLFIEIPFDGTITFDWGYQSTDTGEFDSGGYVINGDYTVLAFNNTQVPFFDETATVEVSAGDIFAFRVQTDDGQFGAGELGITNFEFVEDLPDFCSPAAGASWLTATPDSGSTPAGGSDAVTIDVDTTGLAPGQYEGALCVSTNDPDAGLVVVPVSLEVIDPTLGTLEGTVESLGHCSDDPFALEGAEVTVLGDAGGIFETTTDASGFYSLIISENESPMEVLVEHPDHLPGAESGVIIEAGETTVVDFSLVLDAACAAVDPEEVQATVVEDGTATRSLEIGNLAGAGELSWSLETAEVPAGFRVLEPFAADPVRGGSSNAETLSSLLGGTLPSLSMARPSNGLMVVDCESEPGIVIQDDGTVENGYSGNPATINEVRFVDRFTPDEYPAYLTGVCVAFLTISGTTSLDIDIVVYDDSGAGGSPGAEIGSLAATVDVDQISPPVPPDHPPVWTAIDLSSLGIEVTSGSVYVGVSFAPEDPNYFIASDQSTDRPVGFAGGHWWNSNDQVWEPIQVAYPDYRALMVRPVLLTELEGCDAPEAISWLSVDPDTGTIAAGDSALVDVMFDADGLTEGVYEALLCLNSNDPVNPIIEIPVTMEVIEQDPAILDADPTDLVFGTVIVGEDATLGFVVSNAADPGAMSLELSTLSLSGDAEFAITGGDCGAGTVLEAGESCGVDVIFTPSDGDSYAGSILVDTTNGQSATVTLSGEGELLPAELEVDTTLLDFDEVPVDRDETLVFTVSNAAPSGAASLTLSAIGLTGAAEFAVTGGDCTVGMELAPSESCTVEVTFAPSAEETSSAVVAVVTAAGDIRTVSLTGQSFELPEEVFSDRFED